MKDNGYLARIERSIVNSEDYQRLIDDNEGLSQRYVSVQLERFLRILRIGMDENVGEISRERIDKLIKSGGMGAAFRKYVEECVNGGEITSPHRVYRIIRMCCETIL